VGREGPSNSDRDANVSAATSMGKRGAHGEGECVSQGQGMTRAEVSSGARSRIVSGLVQRRPSERRIGDHGLGRGHGSGLVVQIRRKEGPERVYFKWSFRTNERSPVDLVEHDDV